MESAFWVALQINTRLVVVVEIQLEGDTQTDYSIYVQIESWSGLLP